MKRISIYKLIPIIVGVMLILGIFSLPSDYYLLLRWVVTLGLSFYIYKSLEKYDEINVVVLVFIIILFNPIIPFYLKKDVWTMIDIFSGGFLLWNSGLKLSFKD
jgi:hypothetical protein